MKLDWKDDGFYFQAIVSANDNILHAIQLAILKVLQLAEGKDNWNCIMMDMWMHNQGRLICNIQDQEEPVGKDKGFRVALQFHEYSEKLRSTSESEYNQVLHDLKLDLVEKIKEAFNDEDFLMSFDDEWVQNKFTVRVASVGQRLNFEIRFE